MKGLLPGGQRLFFRVVGFLKKSKGAGRDTSYYNEERTPS